jgi:hypothetical protein
LLRFARTCAFTGPDTPNIAGRRAKHLLHDNDFTDKFGHREANLDGKLMGSARYCATSH